MSSKNQTQVLKDVSMSLLVTIQLARFPYVLSRVLLSLTPCTAGQVTLQLSYRWTDSVSTLHSWSKSRLYLDFKHMSVGVTTGVTRLCTHIVTPWQPFISKRRDTLVGIVHGLWTAWNNRSVNLTTHLHVRPELRTVELYLCSSYTPSSQA